MARSCASARRDKLRTALEAWYSKWHCHHDYTHHRSTHAPWSFARYSLASLPFSGHSGRDPSLRASPGVAGRAKRAASSEEGRQDELQDVLGASVGNSSVGSRSSRISHGLLALDPADLGMSRETHALKDSQQRWASQLPRMGVSDSLDFTSGANVGVAPDVCELPCAPVSR